MSEETGIYRADAIYVSKVTRLALSYLPRTDDAPNADAHAEKVLADWLKENHPEVVEHIKTRFEADKKFREKYQRADPKLASLKPLTTPLAKLMDNNAN